MNRQEFMNRLGYLLRGIPASEREDALAYYNDYFDDAGVENEYQVIMELGSPEAVAEHIISNMQSEKYSYKNSNFEGTEKEEEQVKANEYAYDKTVEKKKMSKSTKTLLIILLVFTFPLWIGVVAGLFGTVVGLIGATFGIVVGGIGTAIGLLAGGIGCIIAGIVRLLFAPIESVASIGIGAILTAIGLLLALLCIWCVGIWLPKLVKVIVGWVKGWIHRNKGGNEI